MQHIANQSQVGRPANFRFIGPDQDGAQIANARALRLAMQVPDHLRLGILSDDLAARVLRKFGVAKDYWLATRSEQPDAGLFETTRVEADRNRFRVSMLRNIARTGPYFHDGSVADLKQAVQVMADVQLSSRLPEADAASIVSFLESLTGPIPASFRAPRATP